jgi:hypothetical protein
VLCGAALQGGGFCGSRTKKLDLDLSAYDGLQMRVKGDGQIFKFNIKTVSQYKCIQIKIVQDCVLLTCSDTVPGVASSSLWRLFSGGTLGVLLATQFC